MNKEDLMQITNHSFMAKDGSFTITKNPTGTGGWVTVIHINVGIFHSIPEAITKAQEALKVRQES